MEHPILKRRQVASIYVFKERIWSSLKNAPLYLEFIVILGKKKLLEGHSLENSQAGKGDMCHTKLMQHSREQYPIHSMVGQLTDSTEDRVKNMARCFLLVKGLMKRLLKTKQMDLLPPKLYLVVFIK